MLFSSESDKAIELLQNNSNMLKPKEFGELLGVGRRERGQSYFEQAKAIALRYNGIQAEIVRAALRKRYPRTYAAMPVDPVNWLKFFAVQDSGVYENLPKRYLVDENLNTIADDDERMLFFKKALDQISVNSKMKVMERRCASGHRASVVMLSHRRINSVDKIVAQLYWPQDVVTIAHEYAPDDVDALHFVALKQNQTTSDGVPIWQLWTRDHQELDGELQFGPWSYRLIAESGTYQTPPTEYQGRLPIAFLFTEEKSGFWPAVDTDVTLNVDNLNVARSNRQFVIDMQAHSQRVYRGTLRETSEIESGPDSIMQIGPNEEFEVITFNANHDAIENSATRDLQEQGVARGNSPDAYSVKPIVTQSGIAKVIANAPHTQRIEDMKPIFINFEETQLLPIVVELIELFAVDAPSMAGLTPKIQMPPQKSFEDDKILADRVQIMRNMSVISRAEARVLLKLSKDLQTAEQAIAERDLEAMPENEMLTEVTTPEEPEQLS